MMKLKHLLDNRPLVMTLLQNWAFDADRADVLEQFRISSNAIYPFYSGAKLCFLRFAPLEEKSIDSVQAELDFLCYLRGHGLGVAEVVPNLHGEAISVSHTQWGDYLAVVFRRVAGAKMEGLAYEQDMYYRYGEALGHLHQLSIGYHPVGCKRINWEQQLDWVEACLRKFRASATAFDEARLLRSALSSLPLTAENYGLVHYDYELDNVFYAAEEKLISIIDFDDAVYHWYAMDVERALHNLQEELDGEVVAEAQQAFMQGYLTKMALSEQMLAAFPLFNRYAALYQYARCLRATSEHLEHEPDWMHGLRTYLDKLMQSHADRFGTKLANS